MVPAIPAEASRGLESLLPSDEDLLYEEELLRNPYSLKMWWRYLEARKEAPTQKRHLLYERALKALPGSYKLWYAYLRERALAVRGLPPQHRMWEGLVNTYERAMVSMHKMPRMWIDFLQLLVDLRWVTRTRRAFDRALCALPITQHDRIWQMYLKFVMQPGMPSETAFRVYRRYLKLEPTHTEEFIAYLRSRDRWGEAAQKLAEIVNNDMFRSLEGKSKHQLWLELCDIVTKHPKDVTDMKVDAILRSGIRKFTDEVGRLWTSLADFYIRQGMYEKARDVYEEGMTTVTTVRDFSLIFDTLTQFEESLLTHKMQQAAEDGEESEEEDITPEQKGGIDFLQQDSGRDIELRLAQLEHLLERRPELLSSVMLRQNPHNVFEWHKRVKLFEGDTNRQIITYTEAVKTVDAEKAIGKPHSLWTAFARLYERHGDVPNARIIFQKATEAPFKYVDDLATVWTEFAEMELRHKNFQRAMSLIKQATTTPANLSRRQASLEEREGPVQKRLYRSLKLWSLYCDLAESLGTREDTRKVYDRILELRIATPQIILNYALFLQEHKYWEESFQVYERGIALFKWPHVRDIWRAYLSQFVQRYGGTKLERARDLFRQALDSAPPPETRPLFLQYAELEEKFGLARSAMAVYDEAVRTVPVTDRLPVYQLYISRASQFFGVGKVREIYETAIEAEEPYNLTDADCRTMSTRYAALEQKLGEIDRARAIYVHSATLAHPQRDRDFWTLWNDFEVAHGNEDTFREMLRIKRSVQAAFSNTHFNTTIVDASAAPSGTVEAGPGATVGRSDDMAALEAEVAPPPLSAGLSGFVSAGTIQSQKEAADGAVQASIATSEMANPEDIELGDMDAEEQVVDAGDDLQVEQKAVPDAVFGASGIQPRADGAAADTAADTEPQGALERLKKRRIA